MLTAGQWFDWAAANDLDLSGGELGVTRLPPDTVIQISNITAASFCLLLRTDWLWPYRRLPWDARDDSFTFSAELQQTGVRRGWGGGGVCGRRFPRKKRKKMEMLQGHQRVMFRFLRSSYEKVDECRDFWLSVLQFGLEFIQQSRKSTLSWHFADLAEKEKMRTIYSSF